MFFNNSTFFQLAKMQNFYQSRNKNIANFLKNTIFVQKYSSCLVDETLSYSFDIVFGTYAF